MTAVATGLLTVVLRFPAHVAAVVTIVATVAAMAFMSSARLSLLRRGDQTSRDQESEVTRGFDRAEHPADCDGGEYLIGWDDEAATVSTPADRRRGTTAPAAPGAHLSTAAAVRRVRSG